MSAMQLRSSSTREDRRVHLRQGQAWWKERDTALIRVSIKPTTQGLRAGEAVPTYRQGSSLSKSTQSCSQVGIILGRPGHIFPVCTVATVLGSC